MFIKYNWNEHSISLTYVALTNTNGNSARNSQEKNWLSTKSIYLKKDCKPDPGYLYS